MGFANAAAVWAFLGGLALGASGAGAAGTAADHYHWKPAAADGEARPWVLLLTGASGMAIGQDQDHYHRAAAWLNARGIDALIVDYQKAVKLVPQAAQGATPGEKIYAVAADAIAVERAQGRMPKACPGAAIAWSLGSEGGWLLARENAFKLRGVAFYYPTAILGPPYRNTAPILVLQGEADDLTPLAGVRDFLAARPADAASARLVSFPGAFHGFDVPSLPTVKPPPSEMPPGGVAGTFLSNPAAAAQAEAALETFLKEIGVAGGRCG